MTYIKKVISGALLAILLFSTVSCGLVYIPNNEEKAFESILPKLFEALDSDDNVAIYELFSPAVREQSDNLQEQITALISVYSGPTDEFNYEDVPMQGSGHIGNPGNWASAYATIPVRSSDNYYFFEIDLIFEHYDEKQVGITQLEFYTADEMCAFRESDESWIERKGLYVHAEADLQCEIRTIDSYPLRYTSKNHIINLNEVEEFIKSSSSFREFTEKFGEANAKSPIVDYYYYELPKEKGEPRYLLVDEHEEIILSLTIVDDFKFIDLIWENE